MNIVLVGKTGSGKTEIARILTEYFRYDKLVTCTTRKRRDGEPIDAYIFMSDDEYDKADMVLKTRYCGNRYGALVEALAGCENKVLVVDPKGLRELKDVKNFDFVSFFISCGTFKRYNRCIERGDDKEVVLARIMNEPRDYDMLKTDFVVENEDRTAWDTVAEILERVKEVVDCSHQSSTKSESCQQV